MQHRDDGQPVDGLANAHPGGRCLGWYLTELVAGSRYARFNIASGAGWAWTRPMRWRRQ